MKALFTSKGAKDQRDMMGHADQIFFDGGAGAP